jgi:hypothetical protein
MIWERVRGMLIAHKGMLGPGLGGERRAFVGVAWQFLEEVNAVGEELGQHLRHVISKELGLRLAQARIASLGLNV